MATADGSNREPGSILSPRLFCVPLDVLKYEEPAMKSQPAPGSRTWSWLQIRLEPGAGVTVSQTKRFCRPTTKLNRIFLERPFLLVLFLSTSRKMKEFYSVV